MKAVVFGCPLYKIYFNSPANDPYNKNKNTFCLLVNYIRF